MSSPKPKEDSKKEQKAKPEVWINPCRLRSTTLAKIEAQKLEAEEAARLKTIYTKEYFENESRKTYAQSAPRKLEPKIEKPIEGEKEKELSEL